MEENEKLKFLYDYETAKDLPESRRYTDYIPETGMYVLKINAIPADVEERLQEAIEECELHVAGDKKDWKYVLTKTARHNLKEHAFYSADNISQMLQNFFVMEADEKAIGIELSEGRKIYLIKQYAAQEFPVILPFIKEACEIQDVAFAEAVQAQAYYLCIRLIRKKQEKKQEEVRKLLDRAESSLSRKQQPVSYKRQIKRKMQTERKVFRDCRMEGYDFREFDLENAIFIGCSLVKANFSGTNLENAVFIDCNLTECVFYNAHLNNTWIFSECRKTKLQDNYKGVIDS